MPADHSSLRVLVVDDEQVSRQLVIVVLNSLGISTIDEAANGQEALDKVNSAPQAYSLVVCDWDMPVMTGVEFLEKFRSAHSDTPFVMVTARTGTAEFNDAKRKGADFFLMKPLDADGLQLRLGMAVTKAAQVSG